MNKVILINPFEVPVGQEEAALRFWARVGDYMRWRARATFRRFAQGPLSGRAVHL